MSKKNNAISGLLILALFVWGSSYFSGGKESPQRTQKVLAKEEKKVRTERLNSQPLRVTEHTSLDEEFGVTFCTNKYVHYETDTHRSKTRLSYVIQTKDGKRVEAKDHNLGLNFVTARSAKFTKKDPDSEWCHTVRLESSDFWAIPFLQYQKGYNARDKPDMRAKEDAEKEAFRKSITSVLFKFTDKTGKEIFTILAPGAAGKNN